ncbi:MULTISPECIES: hypothetical protein [Methylobacter]
MQENELKMGQAAFEITPLNTKSQYIPSTAFDLIKLQRSPKPSYLLRGDLTMEIDLTRLALPISSAVTTTTYVPQPNPECPKLIIDDKFLKGPISLTWLQAASLLPGKSFHIAIVICFPVGLKKSNRAKLTQRLLNEFDIKRYCKYQALIRLSVAGPISQETTKEKKPIAATLLAIRGNQI